MAQSMGSLEGLDQQHHDLERIGSRLEMLVANVAAVDKGKGRELMLHLEDLIADLHALYWFVWGDCEPDQSKEVSEVLTTAAELATAILNDPSTKWIVREEQERG